MCDATRRLLGTETGGISPLGPDLLAAAFSVSILKHTVVTTRDLLEKSIDLTGTDAWSRLWRAAFDLYDIDDLSIIGDWILLPLDDRSVAALDAVENLEQTVSVAHCR